MRDVLWMTCSDAARGPAELHIVLNIVVPTLPEDVKHEGVATYGAVKDRPGCDAEGAM